MHQEKKNVNTKLLNFIVPTSVFLGGIGGGIVFPILPILGVQFSLAPIFIAFILAANRITRLFFNQPVGFIVDKIGGKIPLIIGLLTESIGSLLYAYALTVPYHGIMLLFGRIIWGIGSAFVFISGNTIALNASVHATRGRSTARIRVALSLGVPAGVVIGGVLSSLFSNNIAFLSSAILSFMAALFAIIFFKDINLQNKKGENINLIQSVMHAYKNKNLFMICIFNFLVFFSFQGVILTTLVLFVKNRNIAFLYSDPRFSAGILMAFAMVSSGISGLITGKIIDFIKIRSLMSIPSVLIVIFGFIFLGLSYNFYMTMLSLIVIGIGTGINNVTLLSIFGDLTPPHMRGSAVSVYQFMGDLGGTFGPLFGIQIGLSMHNFYFVYILTAIIFSISIPIVVYIYKNEKKHLIQNY